MLLQESAEKMPKSAEVKYHLGTAHYLLGNEEPARAALEESVKATEPFSGIEDAKKLLALLLLDTAKAVDKKLLVLGLSAWAADLTQDPPTTPMPTIVSRYQAGANTAILVRRYNNLPQGVPSGGYGRNQISIHLHNFHSAPDSDGAARSKRWHIAAATRRSVPRRSARAFST